MSHHLDRFSSVLEYNVAYLEEARSIAMTSFFSMKSISHLDLHISECSANLFGYDPMFYFLDKSFFCTEESFRNNIVPERRILYALNLDVPKEREYSNLRSGFAPEDLPYNSGKILNVFVAVTMHDDYFWHVLDWLIESAFEQTDCRLKWLNWMADFGPMQSVGLSFDVQSSCAMTLYRDCVDSAFTVEFFRKFIQLYTFRRIGDLEVLEHFLHIARVCDFKIREEKTNNSNLTDFFITDFGFQLVPSILKYEDTVYYTDTAYEDLKLSISIIRGVEEEMNMLENRISKSRLYRMMQIIHIFGHHDPNPDFIHQQYKRSDVSEALRLVWSSIPDSYVPLEEMIEAYEHVHSSDYIRQAHEFYEEAIGRIVSHREPRLLIQYCRTAIRRSVCQSKQWLPDGINQLSLPTRFKSFLNLQRVNLRLENFLAP